MPSPRPARPPSARPEDPRERSALYAIHGIVLVGAILVAGTLDAPFNAIIGIVLVILASLNVFGGFTVTERMLEMFKPRAAVVKKEID